MATTKTKTKSKTKAQAKIKTQKKEELHAAFTHAAAAATAVAEQARRQLTEYKDAVLEVSKVVDTVSAKVEVKEAEREMMQASSHAISSAAGVLIHFANTAVEQFARESQDTRREAVDLARKVLKLAFDDVLESAFDPAPSRAPGTGARVELYADEGSQNIPVARTKDARGTLKLSLTGNVKNLKVKTKAKAPKDWVSIGPRAPFSLQVEGEIAKITLRAERQQGVDEVQVGVLHISDGTETLQRVPLIVRSRRY